MRSSMPMFVDRLRSMWILAAASYCGIVVKAWYRPIDAPITAPRMMIHFLLMRTLRRSPGVRTECSETGPTTGGATFLDSWGGADHPCILMGSLSPADLAKSP